MDKPKNFISENILLLIIAVTLLGVKLSDATILLKTGEEKKANERVVPGRAVHDGTKLSTGDSTKVAKEKSKKAVFTFTLSDLNRFSAEEMLQLDGVGPVLAERIVSYRKKHGSIKAISELKQVKGIGPKKYAAIMKQYR